MSYLSAFQAEIKKNDYPGFLRIWEEYCYSDVLDADELLQILQETKSSELAIPFGKHIERILPLWKKIENPQKRHEILKVIFDLQNTNSEELAELVFLYLKETYPDEPFFEEKLRLIGLRSRENFQSAISYFDLLHHMAKGKFVFHKGGWGTGEILEISHTREEVILEFDLVPGKKHFSFINAMKTLVPISNEHFLARRFGNPDLLEKEAKENPVEIVRLLLRNLGPKSAQEIKEELIDLVIPAKEWSRWWQMAKTKLKKDAKIASPDDENPLFFLRDQELSFEKSFYQALENKKSAEEMIAFTYAFLRDFPESLKNEEFKNRLLEKFQELLASKDLSETHYLQVLFLVEDLVPEKFSPLLKEKIQTSSLEDLEKILAGIEILSLKKRALVLIRTLHKDWEKLFFSFLFSISHNILREYLLSELQKEKKKEHLKEKIQELLQKAESFPLAFFWYFHQLLKNKDSPLFPFSDTKGRILFFEKLLILLDFLSHDSSFLNLAKKIASFLTKNRFAIVREVFKDASFEEVKELLLLSSKCLLLSEHDRKIFQSLAKVAYPSLGVKIEHEDTSEENSIWTTQEGYEKIRKRITQISTSETVENAREIEEARSHGDLRENAEYKAALEKRARLQGELKFLSEQFQKARILSKKDISLQKVGVGTVVKCKNGKGKKISFSILGPWDANPEKNILSYQSKFARALEGLKVGETFEFQGEKFTVEEISHYFS